MCLASPSVFRIATWHQDQDELSQALKMHYKAAIDDHEASKQTLKDLAENGNGEAAFLWGHVECKASNWAQAMRWYQTAAQQTAHPEAMYCLGQLHQNGYGTIEKDTAQAFAWHGDAAKHGSKHALNEWLDKSTSQPHACFQLARLYELGEGGLVSQPQKALTLYTQASAMGHAQASVWLGELEEKKAEPDLPTAYRYYALAAYQHDSDAKIYLEQLATDNAEAQYALGFHYYQAQDDDSQAAYWCVKAHLLGHALALDYLTQSHFSASVYLQMAHQYETEGTVEHLPHAIEFYKKASALGEAQASFSLAQLYETGNEVMDANPSESIHYYVLAIEQKHPDARVQLEHLASTGSAQAQYAFGYHVCRKEGDMAQAARWCVKADI